MKHTCFRIKMYIMTRYLSTSAASDSDTLSLEPDACCPVDVWCPEPDVCCPEPAVFLPPYVQKSTVTCKKSNVKLQTYIFLTSAHCCSIWDTCSLFWNHWLRKRRRRRRRRRRSRRRSGSIIIFITRITTRINVCHMWWWMGCHIT